MIILLLCSLLLVMRVDAHGFMTKPEAVYKDQSTKTTYIYRVDGNKIFPGIKWNDSPRANTNELIKKMNDGSFPPLKMFMDKYITGCPFNDLSSTVDVSNLNYFQWQNDEERQGFVPSHEGPCEIWFDNNLIFQNNNCREAYTDYPAVIPLDYSSCGSSCLLSFYWMSMQEPQWQMYKGCVMISYHGAPKNVPSMVPVTPSPNTPSPVTTPSTSMVRIPISGNTYLSCTIEYV